MNPSNKPAYVGRAMDYVRAGLIGATGLLVAACASPTQEERFARFLKENDKAFSTTIEACLKTYDGKPLPAREQQTAKFFQEQVQKQYGVTLQDLDNKELVTAYCSDSTASYFAKEFSRLEREADAGFGINAKDIFDRMDGQMRDRQRIDRQMMEIKETLRRKPPRQVKPN